MRLGADKIKEWLALASHPAAGWERKVQSLNEYLVHDLPILNTTMKRNLVVAVIIIILFLVLALVGYGIYALQNRVSISRKPPSEDEED
ncbi:MAG: hypothetical protein Q9163_000800 [Psora crenata]